MNITIGIRGSAREISIDLDIEREELVSRVNAAVQSLSVLDLTDDRGQRYLVPARSIAYVQIGEQIERRVGFAIV
ncbi:MAG: DUF3107 domain-containing protein [Schaalia hyovaginalis]|uniref:DUF3107 domain-containing protein n=1 Tax=Schaalia hyovaginalis TaxID=29316 RepID=UPI0026ED2447|nr:DUF3107 domain-containing protein [Schaalia hyovaginalis]MCI7512345.1 DUF3107 domain-containing protein [Schaalia hyovaginalis]MDY4491956.1 DUF3107 domain-containing protein [Schaalia hyovaginalis]MDY6213877.1 DUF3107 domain-containing protein [Schaalia hyovaginalis]